MGALSKVYRGSNIFPRNMHGTAVTADNQVAIDQFGQISPNGGHADVKLLTEGLNGAKFPFFQNIK